MTDCSEFDKCIIRCESMYNPSDRSFYTCTLTCYKQKDEKEKMSKNINENSDVQHTGN